VEDVRPLVESGGYSAEALERVDRSLDFVSTSVDRLVEADGPAARATTALAVGPLILALGNRVLNLPTPQIAAIPARGVRMVRRIPAIGRLEFPLVESDLPVPELTLQLSWEATP
jgi:hypothetical protein